MTRSVTELARVAQQSGYSLGQLCCELADRGEHARESWALSREEAAILMELPSGPDVDQALVLLAKYPGTAAEVIGLTERQAELLGSVPPSMVPARPPRSPQHVPRGRSSQLARQRVCVPTTPAALREGYDAESETRRLAEVGATALAPQHIRNRLQTHKEPRLVALRNREKCEHQGAVIARKRTHAYPTGGWMQWGVSRRDVLDWLRRAQFSADETEREVVARVARHPWFLVRALTFVLWHLQLPTARAPSSDEASRRFLGVVAGYSRGQLAHLIPCQHHDGRSYVPRTITRALAELRRALEGILEFNQPSPVSAEQHGLPGAWHIRDNGSKLRQADNVYWWRRFAGAAVARVSDAAPPVVDRGSTCYEDPNKYKRLDADPVSQEEAPQEGPKESSPEAPTGSGAHRAPPCERHAAPHAAAARCAPIPEGQEGAGFS